MKRIAARTSVKRYVRHSLGLKAPRGWGWLTNPKKASYNQEYLYKPYPDNQITFYEVPNLVNSPCFDSPVYIAKV